MTCRAKISVAFTLFRSGGRFSHKQCISRQLHWKVLDLIFHILFFSLFNFSFKRQILYKNLFEFSILHTKCKNGIIALRVYARRRKTKIKTSIFFNDKSKM